MTIILLLVGLGLIVLGVMLQLWAYAGRKCRIGRWEGGIVLSPLRPVTTIFCRIMIKEIQI